MLCLTLSTAQAVKEGVLTIYTTHLGDEVEKLHRLPTRAPLPQQSAYF